MPVNLDVKVLQSGPFLAPGMLETTKKHVGAITKHIVELGEARLSQLLRKRPEGVYLQDGGSTGNYRRNVKPVFFGEYSALITDGGVVYGPWLEGVSSRNDRTRFKGYASFRKTEEWLNQQTPGLLQVEAQLMVNELTF